MPVGVFAHAAAEVTHCQHSGLAAMRACASAHVVLICGVQVEKHIQRVCHSIMRLDSAPDAFRAFSFVTGSYLRGKQETGERFASPWHVWRKPVCNV